jgi:hypothetical protein
MLPGLLNLWRLPILFVRRMETAEAVASQNMFLFPLTRPRTQGADSSGLSTRRRGSPVIAVALTSRPPIRALRPDLDKFLFATVGEETNGIPLSVVSAFARLGVDPWEEAGRLSVLSRDEAAEQLARLIAETPGRSRALAEAREVARPLVVLLPNHDTAPRIASQIQIRPRYLKLAAALPTPYWIVGGVLTAAVLFSAIAHHGIIFGLGGP